MNRFGISVALLTPFHEDGSLDTSRLGAHAKDLLERGASSVTLFGTTGENASIGASERKAGIACLREAGIPAEKIVTGLCATAVADVAAQIREGRAAGLRRFLLPPPYYFKGLDAEGLYAWHEAVLSTSEAEETFILYHIPQVTGVPVDPALLARLHAAFPGRIAAIKDSSGNWDTAMAFLDSRTVPVLVGDERLLHRAVAAGSAGAISGMANLYPERMVRLVADAEEDRSLSEETTRVVSGPVIPAIKVLLAAARSDPGWERVRPPLAPLSDEARDSLLRARETAPVNG